MSGWRNQNGAGPAAAFFTALTLHCLIAAGFAAIGGPAHALAPKTCGTQAEISAELNAEGHTLVAGMESHVFNANTGRFEDVAIMLTATADRAAWYLITGDRPFGYYSSQYCVTLKGTALKILGPRGEGAPNASGGVSRKLSRYGFNRARAEKECAAANAASPAAPECAPFDDVLAEMARVYGEVPVLQGRVVSRKGAPRGILTIVADPDNERDYRRLFSSPTGATGILEFGKSFFFAPEVLEALDGGG